jgi:hypothetical protein
VSQFFLKYQQITNSLGTLFISSCFLNVGWILAWHYELIAVSVVLMLGLLFILIRINKAIQVKQEIIMKTAFGIYMGWIFIATIANITALLVSIGWNGLGILPDKWAIAMMTTGALVTIISIASFRNIYLAIPVIWALIGIILKRQQDHSNIVIAGWILIAAVAFAASYWLFKQKQTRAL